MDHAGRNDLNISRPHAPLPLTDEQKPRTLLGVNGFVLEAMALEAQTMILFDENDFSHVMPGVREPELPTPGFLDSLKFHDWKKR
jgi:hypothetical protein